MRKLDSRGSTFAVWFGIFTLIFLLGFSYRYLQDLAMRQSGTFRVRLIEEVTGCYSAALLFLLILKFSRRFRINIQNWPQRLPVYLLAGVVLSLLHTTMMALTRQAIFHLAGMGEYDYGIMPIRYLMEMANFLLFYIAGVTLIHLYDHYQESRERELRTAQVEAQLAQAELQSLQAQIHPHFLFNALNTISSVVYEDARAADTMIARLSDFLRHSVRASRRQEVTLQEELNFLTLYLDIMRPRFEDRLRVDLEVAPGINDALTPKLILQPLVENSIKYAADPDSGLINIAIRASRENGSLRIEVRDDGPGLSANTRDATGNGVGLANTARRLERLYGRNH
ncbi:MAG TPA: histidine kinase, partial [Blastocatellia bacterium]|nr:histidine kinase [Blastocatellia bacterium]